MAKTVPISKFSEWEGVDRVQTAIHAMQCIFRENGKDDFGIDGEIEVVVPKESGEGLETHHGYIKVQVKSGRKYVVQDTDASFATTIEKTHLETWRTANLPVVLIVYHPADDKIYWKEIKPYLKATPDVFREPCRVHFDKAKDELTDKCRDRFAAMVDNSPPRVAADQKERLYTNLLLVKRSLRAAGKDADNFAGHSLRAGLATAAAMAGVSERAIQEQTGHKSLAMLRRYIRAGSLFRENAAAKIGL